MQQRDLRMRGRVQGKDGCLSTAQAVKNPSENREACIRVAEKRGMRDSLRGRGAGMRGCRITALGTVAYPYIHP